MKLYKNGTLISSASGVPNYGNEPISVGAWGGGYLWNGRMDEVRVWNKVLPECQIQQNMNGEVKGIQDGLLINYNFNQGIHNVDNSAITIANDSSGNGNHGTLNNFYLNDTFSNWIGYSAVPYGTPVDVLTIEIDIKGNNVSIANNDLTPSTANHTNWDTLAINQASVKTYTIYNTSTDTLEIYNINTSGADSADFAVQALTYPVKIAGGQNTTFTITLTPSSYLTKNAMVTLNTNDCDEATYTYSIKGFSKLLAPNPVIAMPASICLGDSSKLVATVPLAGINWYNSPTGGTEIGSSMSDSGFYVSPIVKDTFYAESYAIVSGTKTYNIEFSDLTGLVNDCGGGNWYSNPGSPIGFNWVDNAPGNITSAKVDFALGVQCYGGTKNANLNSVFQSSFSANNNCTCGPDENTNGITTINFNLADYVMGGSNQFDIVNDYNGYMQHSGLNNYYAIVTVTYLDTLRSTTRTPVVVNVGCGCNLTSVLPTAAGTYTSTQIGTDGAYTCYCDASNNLLLALDTNGTGAVVPAGGVSLQIGTTTTTAWTNSGGIISNPNGGAIVNRKWNVTPSTQPTSPVKVKYFFTDVEYDSIVARLAPMGTTISTPTQLQMYKLFTGTFADPHAGSATGVVLMNGSTPSLSQWAYSAYSTDHSAEYLVSSFSGGGGGGGSGGVPLPLNLMNLKATAIQNKYIAVQWQTTEEVNTKAFEIQRSTDGKTFATIGNVAARSNYTLQSYLFNDVNVKANTMYFYRLNMLDNNAESKYSGIVLANISNKEAIAIYPNPASNIVTILLPAQTENALVTITDAMGKVVHTSAIAGVNTNNIDINALSTGIYTVSIVTETETKNIKLLKQ